MLLRKLSRQVGITPVVAQWITRMKERVGFRR